MSNNKEMKKTIYIAIAILSTYSLKAQEFLTLEKAREMALSQNEDLKIAETKLEKVTHDKKAAHSHYFPSISASATAMYDDNKYEEDYYLPTYSFNSSTGSLSPNVVTDASGNVVYGSDGNPVFSTYAYLPLELSLQGAYMAGLSLEEAVYAGGKIRAGNKMADIGMEMAKENINANRMKVIAELDQAYWLYVSVQSKVKLAKASVDMLQSLLYRVKDNYDVGYVNRNEVLKVQVEYDKARLNLQKAKSGLELTRMSLCRETGLSFDTPIETDTVIEFNKNLIATFGNEDVQQRPEYKLMSKNIELEQNKVKSARADFLPQIGVKAGYAYVGGVELNNSDFTSNGAYALANISIPLFNWFEGKNKVSSAKAEMQIKEYDFEKNAKLLQLEIEKAKFNLKDAAFRVEMTEDALTQAKENLRVSNDNYEVGKVLLSDLLVAQTQWTQANNEAIEAKTAYKLQETEYLRVTSQLKVESL